MQFETLFDVNGRQIIPGDVLKVWHFRMARWGKSIYMYKLVVQGGKDAFIGSGDHLRAVHLELPLKAEHSYPLKYSLEGTEIVDGPSMRDASGYLKLWCERPKNENVFELGWT